MNYSHFSSLGYTVNQYTGYRIVNPSKQFTGKRERFSPSVNRERFSSSVNRNVHFLTSENGDPTSFRNYLSQHPVSFVWFFAEWCGHCKVMEGDFKIVADRLSDKVNFVKVDADLYKELCAEYNVTGYPTLKLFREGKFVEDYKGNRNANGFIKWLGERV